MYAALGAISNCFAAIAEYTKFGRIREIPPLPDQEEPPVPETGSAPFLTFSNDSDVPPYPIRSNTDTPSIWLQIMNMATTAAFVVFDGSTYEVGDEKWAVLLAYTPLAIVIKIKPSRSKITIQIEFGWMLARPAVTDMYLAGNALIGAIQTCLIHLGRKGEGWAIRAGDDSWEYTLWIMLEELYKYISYVNKVITILAGGPNRTACNIGVAFRKNPALQKFAETVKKWVHEKYAAIAEAYKTQNLKLKDSHKMAV